MTITTRHLFFATIALMCSACPHTTPANEEIVSTRLSGSAYLFGPLTNREIEFFDQDAKAIEAFASTITDASGSWSAVLWAAYTSQSFTDKQGRIFGIAIADKGEAAPTLSIGLALDYRVLNLFFVGIAVRYAQAFSGKHARYVSMPIQASYYW